MTIKLNHTIVHSDDKRAAAKFFTELFGLPAAKPFGPFLDDESLGKFVRDPQRWENSGVNSRFEWWKVDVIEFRV